MATVVSVLFKIICTAESLSDLNMWSWYDTRPSHASPVQSISSPQEQTEN